MPPDATPIRYGDVYLKFKLVLFLRLVHVVIERAVVLTMQFLVRFEGNEEKKLIQYQ